MHSKWTVLAAVFHILQSTASGQLSITSVDSSGMIAWSNCFAGLPFDNTNRPIYSVDWSSSSTGVWQRAALVTNVYSFMVDESLRRAQTNLLVRVEWVNATSAPPYGTYEIVPVVPNPYELNGRVVLLPETNSISGSWHMQPTSWNPLTNGYVFGGVHRSMVAIFLHGGPTYYALDGWYNGTGFTGQWYRCGIRAEVARSQRGHFNIIHSATSFKADVYPTGRDELNAWAFRNKRPVPFQGETLVLAPPEYVIVRKLEYFREGGSDKHLRDIRGILNVSGEQLDRAALDEWIARRGVQAEWLRASR